MNNTSDRPVKSYSGKIFSNWITKFIIAFLPAIIVKVVPNLDQFVESHLILILFLYVVYLVSVFCMSIIKEVWHRIRPKIVDWLEQLVLNIFSRFYKRYKDRLIAYNQIYSVQGLAVQSPYSLELRKVFIELNLGGFKTSRDKPDKDVADSDRKIWEFLQSDVKSYRVLVIIGKPGSGKTTLLQNIALSLATRKAPGRLKYYIPFHMPLRKHVKEIVQSEKDQPTLAKLFQQDYNDLKPTIGWFDSKLFKKGNKCIVLLDGLDEVADKNERGRLVKWVEEQALFYPQAHFIITSRPHGYLGNPIEQATVLELADYSQQQIFDFVHKWYQATEIAATGKENNQIIQLAEKNARDLLQRIFKSEVLSKLAINPLLLRMITTVHRFKADLPEKRAALYEDINKVLIGRREYTQLDGVRLDYLQKRMVLQKLALAVMKKQQREITLKDAEKIVTPDLVAMGLKEESTNLFLPAMMNETGLLVESDVGKIAFAHLTYQEFLAASAIEKANEGAFLVKKVGESWWHETILLYAAIADATEIVRKCLGDPVMNLEKLKLAYEISQEAFSLAPEERSRLESELLREAESDDPQKRQVAADLIFEIRLKKMIRLRDDLEVDPFFVSQLEYQNFIIETELRPDHWSGLNFPRGESLKPIVGVRRTDAIRFTEWLTSRAHELGHRQSYFRLPSAYEIQQVAVSEDVIDPNFRSLAVENIGVWARDRDQVVLSDCSILTADFHRQLMGLGREEINRISDYHATLHDELSAIINSIPFRDFDFGLATRRLRMPDFDQALKELSIPIKAYASEVTELRLRLREFKNNANIRGFSIVLDMIVVDNLETKTVELSRLLYLSSEDSSLQRSQVGEVINSLSSIQRERELLLGLLRDFEARLKQQNSRLFNRLPLEMERTLEEPLDFDRRLTFLKKREIAGLNTAEIRLVHDRKINKDYQKARSELLAIAEYAINKNRDDLLTETLSAFWAIFFTEQRSKRENPIPAWEGIRLAREIRVVDDRRVLQP